MNFSTDIWQAYRQVWPEKQWPYAGVTAPEWIYALKTVAPQVTVSGAYQ